MLFGFVNASVRELSREELARYNAVYCGICRGIRDRGGQLCRLALSYDMAFLALLLMSLYEPEETSGKNPCLPHPLHPRPWLDNPCVRYASDMNIALAYYKALDDRQDDGSLKGAALGKVFEKALPQIEEAYPRQCGAIADCIRELNGLEAANCSNADQCAACFGRLMGELLVWREDLWSDTLRQMGQALGRFIYLADAAVDYRKDRRHHKYNPFLAMGMGEDRQKWEEYLVLAMGRCTEYFERLPLVQDKAILDNILYSGVWTQLRAARPKAGRGQEEENDRRSV